jgi:hypothetical protein
MDAATESIVKSAAHLIAAMHTDGIINSNTPLETRDSFTELDRQLIEGGHMADYTDSKGRIGVW